MCEHGLDGPSEQTSGKRGRGGPPARSRGVLIAAGAAVGLAAAAVAVIILLSGSSSSAPTSNPSSV